MKKLSLKNLKLTSQDQLQRDQLKTVFGGYGGYGGGSSPGDPTSTSSGAKKKKCCWDDHPTICSKCIKGGNFCPDSGSSLKDC